MGSLILAIDQGTTSSRAIVFDAELRARGSGQREFEQHYPASGWVEHEPEDLWQTVLSTCEAAMRDAGVGIEDIAAIGITNQRETTLVWNRHTGEPIQKAIVWQDRRTSEWCAARKAEGAEPDVTARTGLLLDPYFSATKVTWLLDEVPGARASAERGDLLFGTVDTYLIWRLTGGAAHVTDATNASRTMMYNIHTGDWDDELLRLFAVPRSMLPEVRDCAGEFGTTDASVFGRAVPVLGVAGDQQAATIGQACFEPGMLKSTYGTGCFALLNTGDTPVASTNRLLTTVAYQLDGAPTYALEGAIFVAGAAVQWLRDGLGIIESAGQSGELAAKADPTQSVFLVPAFTGLGAPWWDADARGSLIGLNRNTGPAELACATLQSVGYQTRDLLDAMRGDWAGAGDTVLRVDGGMCASDWTMQFLADVLNAPVDRPSQMETTAVGAAWLAGRAAGLCASPQDFAASWQAERRFEPKMADAERERLYSGWRDAVSRTLSNRS
ncbi:MAG: glycerol kinase GlpK [Pseudomonadota bacterium]